MANIDVWSKEATTIWDRQTPPFPGGLNPRIVAQIGPNESAFLAWSGSIGGAALSYVILRDDVSVQGWTPSKDWSTSKPVILDIDKIEKIIDSCQKEVINDCVKKMITNQTFNQINNEIDQCHNQILDCIKAEDYISKMVTSGHITF